MAGDSEKLKQDEIEDLLRQAQASAGSTPAPVSTPASAAGSASLDQNEIESLLRASGGGRPSAAKPAAAPQATAVAPPPARSAASMPPPRSGDDIQYLLQQAEQAIASVEQPSPPLPGIAPFELRDFGGAPASSEKATLDLLREVDLDVRIELGRTEMYLEEVLKLKRGSVVTLDKLAGDPVDVYVNGRLVARGEVLVMNDNFCVRVAELLTGDEAA